MWRKKLLRELVRAIETLARELVEVRAREVLKCPHEKRVAVYGPMTGGGKEILDKIAKMCSQLGFCTILNDVGFYDPRENKYHTIDEIIPPEIRYVFRKAIQPTLYDKILVSIAGKAVINLYPQRWQVSEFVACCENLIPILGFIITDDLSHGSDNCEYLSEKNEYVECEAMDVVYCRREKFFCPFELYEPMPLRMKEYLLENPESKLVAVQKPEDLNNCLKQFLK